MFEPANYKLNDLLGIAGATIGIIIAGGVFLGGVQAKYIALFDRYRALAGEVRGDGASDKRRGSLLKQISTYRQQIHFLNIASVCVVFALFLFVLTVAAASLSVIYPKALIFRTLGTITLIGGLLLIGASTLIIVLESFREEKMVDRELEDLENVPPLHEALHG